MVYTRKLYQELSRHYTAWLNCIHSGNEEWEVKHQEIIEGLVKRFLPHGSGFDCGFEFDFQKSKPDKLVLCFSYHHMDEYGGYDGWTDHKLIVTPSLANGFDTYITGRDKDGIKDYLYDVLGCALDEDTTVDLTEK